MSLRSTDVPAASGRRQHVWALTHSPTRIPPPPRSKCTGRGTAASVNTPQSAEWVMHDLGLTVRAGVCVCSAGWYLAWPTSAGHMKRSRDRAVNLLHRDSLLSWAGGTGLRGGRGGSAGKGDMCVCVRVCLCSALEAALTCGWHACWRSEWGGGGRGHPSSFCCNGRFKWPLASSWSLPVSLLPPAAAARCISQPDHLIASPGGRGGGGV